MSRGYAAVVGMFDGVHRGHRFLLDLLAHTARSRSLKPRVVTFSGHPLEVIAPERAPRLISDPLEKEQRLGELGLDVTMLNFTPELRRESADDFMHRLATEGVETLVMGYDNRFGHNAPRDFNEYRHLAASHGIDIICAEEYDASGSLKISSSEIRRLLCEGDIAGANLRLGYPYPLTGTVVPGQYLGTSLGYPTANIAPRSERKLIPAVGVYAARAKCEGIAEPLPAMVNIGVHPTVGAADAPVVEAHLINYSGDIYGRHLTLEFIGRIRPEQHFPSTEALTQALKSDSITALRLLDAANK